MVGIKRSCSASPRCLPGARIHRVSQRSLRNSFLAIAHDLHRANQSRVHVSCQVQGNGCEWSAARLLMPAGEMGAFCLSGRILRSSGKRTCPSHGQTDVDLHGHVRLPAAGSQPAAQRAITGDPMPQRPELRQRPRVDVDHLLGGLPFVSACWRPDDPAHGGKRPYRNLGRGGCCLHGRSETARRSPVAGSGGRARGVA